MAEYQHILHNIPPVWDKNSEILILGSFPSVKSREACFFYGHPQNRFWRVLATVIKQDIPVTVEQKKEFLLNNRIALWDVIGECDIKGSSDASIKNVRVNDISEILNKSRVKRIFVNGSTAEKLYNKYILPEIGKSAEKLPSTSPLNAAFSFEKLCAEWLKIV